MSQSISRPVGPWEDPVVKQKDGNRQVDVELVQRLLANASDKLGDKTCQPGTADGKIARAPANSSTLKAIEAFQKRFMKSPDRRVDVGGTTWKNLAEYADNSPQGTIVLSPTAVLGFCQEMMDGHCKYGFGKKASPLSTSPSKVTEIDCSGFVRYLLYQVTNGGVVIPDGSWAQDEWFRKHRFPQVEYATAAKLDGVLRLGYFSGSPGHIWFIQNGKTIESHGKSRGPNRRSWNTSVLQTKVQRCYEVSYLAASHSRGGVLV